MRNHNKCVKRHASRESNSTIPLVCYSLRHERAQHKNRRNFKRRVYVMRRRKSNCHAAGNIHEKLQIELQIESSYLRRKSSKS